MPAGAGVSADADPRRSSAGRSDTAPPTAGSWFPAAACAGRTGRADRPARPRGPASRGRRTCPATPWTGRREHDSAPGAGGSSRRPGARPVRTPPRPRCAVEATIPSRELHGSRTRREPEYFYPRVRQRPCGSQKNCHMVSACRAFSWSYAPPISGHHSSMSWAAQSRASSSNWPADKVVRVSSTTTASNDRIGSSIAFRRPRPCARCLNADRGALPVSIQRVDRRRPDHEGPGRRGGLLAVVADSFYGDHDPLRGHLSQCGLGWSWPSNPPEARGSTAPTPTRRKTPSRPRRGAAPTIPAAGTRSCAGSVTGTPKPGGPPTPS
jgi:hypothetical protein